MPQTGDSSAIAILASDISKLSKSAVPRIIAGIVDNQDAIPKGGIDTPLRLCHFMAQLAHESAHLTVTREFASGKAYENRKDLGNVEKGDGVRYKGRGLIQTTGRVNYKDATADIRHFSPDAPDFVADPTELEEFPWALLSAISFWRRKNINVLADEDDIEAVTKVVNGGLNGIDDRRRYLKLAKAIWKPGPLVGVTRAVKGGLFGNGAAKPDTSKSGRAVLKQGDSGDDVFSLQKALTNAGFSVNTDGTFGEYTKTAVIAFQHSRGLTADGAVGGKTWAALGLK
jgi:putative chitinase